MINNSKPQACTVFGIRGAKVMPFLEMQQTFGRAWQEWSIGLHPNLFRYKG